MKVRRRSSSSCNSIASCCRLAAKCLQCLIIPTVVTHLILFLNL